MAEVDVGRIVPSTRDLLLAVATHRKSLALLAKVEPGAPIPAQAARLAALDVRAFAIDASGEPMRELARSTASTPTLSLAVAATTEDCQRARFFGADAVTVGGDPARWAEIARATHAMRMMPVGRATTVAEAVGLAGAGAKAVLLDAAELAVFVEVATALPSTVLVARPATVDTATLRALVGVADAALVPAASAELEAWLDELDG